MAFFNRARTNDKRLPLIIGTAAAAAITAGALFVSTANAAPPGNAAPAFTEVDTAGKQVSLADFKGKTVILEWTNDGCPFVQKHYNSKNMQQTQAAATKDGVIWLSVISSKPGSQGHVDAAAANKLTADRGAKPTHVLLDPDGSMGRAYGAKTTPHMYVIDPAGKLVYAGGIDDKRSAKVEDVAGAKNFVKTALNESLAGQPVSTPTAPPYGCSVKYGAGAS
jgi:peroxiredoxin